MGGGGGRKKKRNAEEESVPLWIPKKPKVGTHEKLTYLNAVMQYISSEWRRLHYHSHPHAAPRPRRREARARREKWIACEEFDAAIPADR